MTSHTPSTDETLELNYVILVKSQSNAGEALNICLDLHSCVSSGKEEIKMAKNWKNAAIKI